ncbi:hypothetical protein VNO80_16481 [Phaseolus coccineus]|uniref:Uncharacterized protein n=1 Tax=Phaseolus coccineus TaxID=3886 RepID=A0AAN9R812_PHACN
MFRRCEGSRVGGIRNSFNNKGDGTQDFSNSTIIIIDEGWRLNPILNLQLELPKLELPKLEALQLFPPLVWGCIALATSLIWIAEAYIIGLGRAARVVVSGDMRFSDSLSQGSEAITNSFNNEGNGVQYFHNTTIIILA